MKELPPIDDHDAPGEHLVHDLPEDPDLQIAVDALFSASDARFRQSMNESLNVPLPPLDEVLAELNERISTGEITFAEAEEALKRHGEEE